VKAHAIAMARLDFLPRPSCLKQAPSIQAPQHYLSCSGHLLANLQFAFTQLATALSDDPKTTT
jgi:hypothetical protein